MFLIYVIKPSFAPKECHTRAWHVVRDFIQETMNIFPSKMEHAESALLPTAKKWIRTCLDDMNCRSPDDHTIILWLNCPVVGIMSSEKYDYFLTCICNLLADWPKNSVCDRAPKQGGIVGQKDAWGPMCFHVFMLVGYVQFM